MNLTYLNYKLPLTRVTDGYGYLGTLGQTEDSEHLQCHICGELFRNLGAHVFSAHGIKAVEYREKFQLGRRTPLVSDNAAEEYKKRALRAWNNKSEADKEQQRNLMKEARKKAVRVGQPRSLESLNKDGMCPGQLIEKITTLAEKLGKSPTHKEFTEEYNGKYIGAINRTFGSWNGAKAMAKLAPCKSGGNPHNKSDYTNEQLLGFLKSFYTEKKVIPTASDFNRGFLPSRHLYVHRFGGMKKARELAGVVEN